MNNSYVSSKHSDTLQFISPNEGIRAEVVFGNPNNNCQGLGICNITIEAKSMPTQPAACRCLRANACVKAMRGNQLHIAFERQSLSGEVWRHYFKSHQFVLPECFNPSAQLRARTGYRGKQIMAGLYPLKISEDWIEVLF